MQTNIVILGEVVSSEIEERMPVPPIRWWMWPVFAAVPAIFVAIGILLALAS